MNFKFQQHTEYFISYYFKKSINKFIKLMFHNLH